MRMLPLTIAALALGACTTLPDLPLPRDGVEADAPYPDFVPMRRVALEERAADVRNAQTEAALEARLARLRARAAQLRRAPID